MTVWSPIRLSPIHQRHLDLGATMAEKNGWQQPIRYTPTDVELGGIQKSGGFCDISPISKIFVQGESVGQIVKELSASEVGHVSSLSLNNNEHLAARLADDHMLIITATDQLTLTTEALAQNWGSTSIINMTSALAGIRLAGPLAQELISRLTDLDISARGFPDYSCAQSSLAHVHTIVVRSDNHGLLSYDLYISRDLGQYMWDEVSKAGHDLGIIPFGIEALDQLREGS